MLVRNDGIIFVSDTAGEHPSHDEAEDINTLGYHQVLGNTNYAMSQCHGDWRAFDLENAEAAAAYIQINHDRPFFLSVGFFNTHRIFPDVSPENGRYVQVPTGVSDTP